MIRKLELLITAFIIVGMYSFIMIKVIEIEDCTKGIIDNVNQHNRQLEMIIEEME